ncbi:tyrosine-protein kinase SRK2 [Brienomyrus brachyistius]|uniref:tyrosine-protein kinase SRK2 n=1 Tax=Brienomyrus brachyistius TaxID=42636 RepID=UPI0020B2BAB7|nr:tyrosine-protein kinase SRK2 [Brienomyrus brachyistius]
MDIPQYCLICIRRLCPCLIKPSADAEPPAQKIEPSAPNFTRPLPPLPEEHRFYVALYDYTARTDDDLSVRAGDNLEVLHKHTEEWWIVRALTGISASKEGYVPSNYLAAQESVYAEPWYFPDTKRADAEKLLLCDRNVHGAFLIRERESQRGELSLSVLDDGKVKHYKVLRSTDGEYYISKSHTFRTLKDLVRHYSIDAGGLCVRLTVPCKKLQAPQTHGLSYNTVDKWEIDRKLIKLIRKLGNGQYGEVHEGLWNNTTPVAVKTPKPGTMDPKDFLQEAAIMKKLRHPKLIQLYAVCTLEEPIYIITELMKNGSLLEYLRDDERDKITLSEQIEMAAQVASGMAYLEQQNYIHRDLAARNVLVGENNICKVADFGLTRVFLDENYYEANENCKFPVKWTAPEAIHFKKFSIKSDVWSFGVLLHEIMTFGQIPYPEMSNMEVVQQLSKGYRMFCPASCPKGLYDIMRDCWKDEACDRPTFETLLWELEGFFDMDPTSYS